MKTTSSQLGQNDNASQQVLGKNPFSNEKFQLNAKRAATILAPFLVLVGAFFINSNSDNTRSRRGFTPPPTLPTTVTVETVRSQEVKPTIIAYGGVRPRQSVTLSSSVSGRIMEVAPEFAEGGAFKKGDILLQIDDTEFQDLAASARARLAEAKSAYLVANAEAEIAAVDIRELAINTPNSLAMREPQLAEATAALEAAKSSLAKAEADVAQTQIRAPFNGRVSTKATELNEFVSPGLALATLFSTDEVEVILPLTIEELTDLGLPIGFIETEEEPGLDVTFEPESTPSQIKWKGRIVRASAEFDSSTRTLTVFAIVKDPFNPSVNKIPLAPGMFVRATIEGKNQLDAVTIPKDAIQSGQRVFVLSDNETVIEKKVIPGPILGDRVVISDGLTLGESLVTFPLTGLSHGMAASTLELSLIHISEPTRPY